MLKALLKTSSILAAFAASALIVGTANAAWQPERPVEFVVTSGAGGGTDTIARTIQSIIVKHKLMDSSIVVTNKGGGSGAEGFVYSASAKGDPYKLTFGTNNEYLLPYVAKLAYKAGDLTPVAAMALDEFLIWVNGESPINDVKAFIEAAKQPDGLRVGGSQSKDTDQTLVSIISDTIGAKFTYVPFKSGGEAAVQLAGNHIHANVNNPNENLGQWKAGMVKPLCVFSPSRMPAAGKVAGDKGWSDIPTCKEAGLPIDGYQMPRTIWLPAGAPPDAVAYYAELLKKVRETPEWKDYIQRTSQTDRYMTGDDLRQFIKNDETKVLKVFQREGWVVQQ